MNKQDELKAKRQELVDHVKSTEDRIAELDKQIAEEAKPKLRHLDICKDPLGVLHVVIHRTDAPDCIAGPNMLCTRTGPEEARLTRISNVRDCFDDLKARQEDVTEFEVTDDNWNVDCTGSTVTNAKLLLDGNISIKHKWQEVTVCQHMSPKAFSAFILKLQQMEMTLLRQKESE